MWGNKYRIKICLDSAPNVKKCNAVGPYVTDVLMRNIVVT